MPRSRRSWPRSGSRRGTAARCLELTILTAARTGEAIGARWSEVDLEAKLWRVPAGRMKGGREHVVPLSGPALEILAALPRSGEHLFEGARSGRPISNMAMDMLLRRMGQGAITVHGFPEQLQGLGGRADYLPEPRGRDGAGACDRGQGGGCLSAGRPDGEAAAADARLGSVLRVISPASASASRCATVGGALSSRRHDLRAAFPSRTPELDLLDVRQPPLIMGPSVCRKLTKPATSVSGRSAGGARLSPIKDRLSVRFGVAPGGGAIHSRAKCQYISWLQVLPR